MKPFKVLIGTGLGAGYLPKAPGTWGSLLTLPAVYIVAFFFGTTGLLLLLITTIILSLWTASEAEEKFGPDPAQFVMDESAGQVMVFLIADLHFTFSHDILILAAGFILFRFFDITKPLGVNALQKLPGKFGILADDLLAGFYSLILLEGIIYLLSAYT